jgi:hypothetical protein
MLNAADRGQLLVDGDTKWREPGNRPVMSIASSQHLMMTGERGFIAEIPSPVSCQVSLLAGFGALARAPNFVMRLKMLSLKVTASLADAT